MSGKNWDRVPIDAQSIDAPLSLAAVFLVVTVASEPAALAKVASVLGGLDDLVKTVGFRDLSGRLSCIAGIGRDLWDRLHSGSRPKELKPFAPIMGTPHMAPSTPGDLLFHIRSERPDMCFEFERILLDSLGDGVTVVDEVSGFRYFDARDLLGFVDGTENPTAQVAIDAAYVGAEDAGFAGGSYMIVQKYLHDLTGWNTLSAETQERIIGRTKLSDIELDDAVKPTYAHNALAKVVVDGKEIKIVRENMPFGRVAEKEFGTYFIGYARSPRTIEQMLENMFIGQPPGNYDRLLDFSVAKTGSLFFVPSATFLENIAEDDPVPTLSPTPAVEAPRPVPKREGSLDIGSLKGDPAS